MTTRCAALLLATNLGCAAPDDDRLVVRGEHVEVELDRGLELCGGQLAVYDQLVVAIPLLLDDVLPPGFNARLHALREEARAETPAGPEATGTARGGDAWFFAQRVDRHELAHVVVTELVGDTARSLREGVAEAVASGQGQAHVGRPSTPIAAFLFEDFPEFDAPDYFHAGMFVRYVIDEYGPAKYRELHQAFSELTDETDGREQFAEVLGTSVEELDAAFSSQTRCAYQVSWCSDHFTEQPLPIEIEERLDCTASDTLGFVGPDPERYTPYRIVRFDLETPTRLSVVGSGVRFGFRRCGDCSEQLSGGFLSANEGETVDATAPLYDWEPGKYYVIVQAIDPNVPVELRIASLP